jgi:ClpP class serine protease
MSILAAVRAQPWAILPEYMAAIEAIALRIERGEAVATVANDGHAERYAAFHAAAGGRVAGTRGAVIAADGLAMVPVFGPIFPRANMMTEMSGATSADILGADLAALDAMKDIRSIMLVVDSPGGAVTGIARLAAQIHAMKTPVIAHVEGVGASAAYWLASQVREISLDPTAAVGSIGVVFQTSVQEGPDGEGRRSIDIVSSNAPDKRADVTTPEGQASIRAMCDAIEAVFIADVARGRGVTPATVIAEYGGGGMKSGQDAKAAGMVDRVEFRAAALERLARQIAPTPPKRTVAEAQQAVAHFRAALN